jgi:hypothetical protein
LLLTQTVSRIADTSHQYLVYPWLPLFIFLGP